MVHIIRLIQSVLPDSIITLLIILARTMFIFSCIFASFGFIGLFNETIKRKNRFGDIVANNVMGIYIVHYTIVTSFQYLFLLIDMPGLLKGIIVALCSFFTSLCIIMLFKKITVLKYIVGEQYKGKKRKTMIVITCVLLLFIILMNIVK